MAFNQELYDLELQEGTIIRIPEGRPNNRPDMRPGAGPGRREAD